MEKLVHEFWQRWMMYDKSTSVSIDRSQAEIKKLLSKHGASAFMFAEGHGKASIVFEMKKKRIIFKLPLPSQPSEHATQASIKTYDQICRSKWRALVLCIKAKLESVQNEITTFEEEFLAHIVMPSGERFGDFAIPRIESSYNEGRMKPLLDWSSN